MKLCFKFEKLSRQFLSESALRCGSVLAAKGPYLTDTAVRTDTRSNERVVQPLLELQKYNLVLFNTLVLSLDGILLQICTAPIYTKES